MKYMCYKTGQLGAAATIGRLINIIYLGKSGLNDWEAAMFNG